MTETFCPGSRPTDVSRDGTRAKVSTNPKKQRNTMKRMYISPRMEVASSEEMTMLAASLINAKNELGDDIDYAKENKNEWELE
jgi:cytoplasmic iron level regulating protein YaaA (DUF328/UPF0246 family)